MIARISGAVTIACAALPFFAGPADASGALFRAKRTWWFWQVDSWTSGFVIPPSGQSRGMAPYEPPSTAYVGTTTMNPRFTAPKSFIKNTTYYFSSNYCNYSYYPCLKGWYSYWNAKGSFRPQNANAPTTTTTVRLRTTMSNPSPTTNSPHTAMGNPVTPTTTWGGRYDFSRGGSIMIWPGKNRFGGTMRFFDGPNDRFYQRAARRYSTATFRPKPLSQQIGTGVEFELGEVELVSKGVRYRLTEPNHVARVIIETPMGNPIYYQQTVNYLVTRAPYTTGKARVWEPLGNTDTIQTATGYDNRTPAGLNGTVSMVHPRLVHEYTVFPPTSGKAIKMTWSSARLRKIDFRFLPEPAGVGVLIAGAVAIAGFGLLREH
jgi:hypothetical protein